ncbi:MAG: SDR family NAD(P)-dependent oxidoreductase [Ignavibacteriae bacterium]|nr:SDR family NAD(P)-dependent oxidoreductase [Ignavibacteriota bacterium]
MALVLVTGGAGFIGSHTVDRLIDEGFDVRILDNLQKPVHLKGTPDYLNPKAEFILGDVKNKSQLQNAMKGVEYIYHLAAYQGYFTDMSNFFLTNSVGTSLIYEIAIEEKIPLKKIIVASSQFVQGEGLYRTKTGEIINPMLRSESQLLKGEWDWKDENSEPIEWQWTPESYSNPPNAYALSKFSQEQQAMTFGKRYEIPSVALRYSIVQGARQSFYNLYSGVCRVFSLSYYFNKSPHIFEDGNQLRDFVNIHDVVDANILALKNDSADYNVFNVGGGNAYSIKQFDRVVANEFGKENILPILEGEFRFGDTRNACSDITKIKKIGWEPKRNITDSVREYKEYLETQTEIEDILEYANEKMKQLNVLRKSK